MHRLDAVRLIEGLRVGVGRRNRGEAAGGRRGYGLGFSFAGGKKEVPPCRLNGV